MIMSATHIHVDGIVLIIFLLFSSLVVLLGSSVYILHSDIEITLMDNVMERLEAEGFQFAVEFDGRDGVVSGSVKNEPIKKEVISIAESVEGVRSIESKLEIISISTPADTKNNPSEISGLSGITEGTSMVDSLDDIISSTIPKPAVVDPEIDEHKVPEGKKDRSETLTEMTEKPILEEVVIQFKPEETKLSSSNEVFLSALVTKLKNDPLLFIEMSSFHIESGVAIKRTKSIKDYFISNGVDKKHFDVLWHDSERQSKVQLKLFHNEEH
jgi:hypothetical protein